MNILRTCRVCSCEAHTTTDLELFVNHKSSKHGKENLCIECSKSYIKEYEVENKEALAIYRVEYREAHKEEKKLVDKTYREVNKVKLAERDRIRKVKKYKEDPQFRLENVLRARLRSALRLRGTVKAVSAVSDLGCSLDDLITHLEASVLRNYGFVFTFDTDYDGQVWHIDHIVPLSKFNLQDPEEQALAVHYTNLQLLTKEDNMKKSNKIEE